MGDDGIRRSFLCSTSQLAALHGTAASDFARRCDEKRLTRQDAEAVRDHCNAATLRVIKTIRFGMVDESVRAPLARLAELVYANVSIVHMARHPWSTLKSQVPLTWYGVPSGVPCLGREQGNCPGTSASYAPAAVAEPLAAWLKAGPVPKLCTAMASVPRGAARDARADASRAGARAGVERRACRAQPAAQSAQPSLRGPGGAPRPANAGRPDAGPRRASPRRLGARRRSLPPPPPLRRSRQTRGCRARWRGR